MCLCFLLVLINLVYAIVPDEDRDGIPDLEDNCSGSDGVVDVYGCDCDQKTKSGCEGDWCCLEDVCIEYDFRASCMYDFDGDGVFNVNDKCVNTGANEIVDGSGCSCSQKTCDDDNLCTDDYCNDTKAECFFVSNNDNYCGDEKRCEEGVCVWDDEDGYSEVSYWSYDPEKGEIRIFYSHSAHTIEVNFKEPLKDEIIILDSTSNVISHKLNEDRTKLLLVVEGDPNVRGVTTIRATQKPVSVIIDEVEVVELKEKMGPRNYVWLYLIAILIILVLILGLILSQRRHEDEVMSSIRREEGKIEKEVDLEAELQLKMYIITNLRRGYTEQQIRNELLKDGWRKEMLDRAFSSLRK